MLLGKLIRNMKDINVCMVHWCYPPTIGGVETFLELLCENLVETGHKVHVITGDRRGRTIEKGIIVHGTDVLGDYRNNIVTIDEYKRCRNYFRKFLKKNKIDILHTHNFQRNFRPAITMAIYSAATEMSIPVVLHVHNPVTTPNATFLVSKIPWDMVFCVSDWITNDVKSMGVANRGAIKTIYNGVDTKKFKPGLDTIKIKKNLGVTKAKKK